MDAKWVLVPSVLALAISANAAVLPSHQTQNEWFTDAKQQIQTKKSLTKQQKAKNVILFVGDGMGVSTLTAARIYQGQMQGEMGEEGALYFENFPYTALVKTYNVDAQTPDSAGTMTAMISGLKTDVGVIGVDEDIARGDCSTVAGNEVVTALELAEIKGLATGVVSTARITHATPAAAFAKSADRNWEDISDMSDAAVAGGCEDIASQLINFEKNLEKRYPGVDVDGIEVAFGGGRRHFLPKDASANSADAKSEVEGDRTDNRNLVTEWQQTYPQGRYVMDQTGFDAIDLNADSHVFGLFNESHMQYEADRSNDIAGEPSLSAMTEKAVKLLKRDEDGFLLVVESGRIDHGHHAGNAYNALHDTVEFAKAVEAAYQNTNPDETLILVTADHSHVFTIAGYPKRGNPILGKVVEIGKTELKLASDGKPYTTVGYANGRGHMHLGDETDADAGYSQDIHSGRSESELTETTQAGFHQEATVPKSSETHAGEDITVHATGPGAHLVQGTVEQSVIYHIMNNALSLEKE